MCMLPQDIRFDRRGLEVKEVIISRYKGGFFLPIASQTLLRRVSFMMYIICVSLIYVLLMCNII